MKNVLLLIITSLASIVALAGSVSTTSKIKEMYVYGTYGASDTQFRNDVAIVIEGNVTGCEAGFWVSAEDAIDNPSLVSVALSAFHAGSDIYLAGYTDQLWNGSGSAKYCRIHALGLKK